MKRKRRWEDSCHPTICVATGPSKRGLNEDGISHQEEGGGVKDTSLPFPLFHSLFCGVIHIAILWSLSV